MRFLVLDGSTPGVIAVGPVASGFFAVGQNAHGAIAIGQIATGVVAIGQVATGVFALGQIATGVIAIGQLARGGVVLGQLAMGLVAYGMLSVGVVWSAGLLGIGGTSGPGVLVYGFFGRFRPGRWRARRHPVPRDVLVGAVEDTPPQVIEDTPPAWAVQQPSRQTTIRPRRLAGRVAGTAVLAVAWWFAAGSALAGLIS